MPTNVYVILTEKENYFIKIGMSSKHQHVGDDAVLVFSHEGWPPLSANIEVT
ncbi:MAG: hypothetical protein HKM06_00105 [Spirochaetales bacterium]|nr:hypothetical protein [Spirochaetales bacterium]